MKISAHAYADGSVVHFLHVVMRTDFVFRPADNVYADAIKAALVRNMGITIEKAGPAAKA